MAQISPLRGIRFNPQHVDAGSVLAPPYDVISDTQREVLYARDLRNIVRIDYGRPQPGDVPGQNDRYTRAAQHLDAWLRLGVLVREQRPAVYVTDHEFTAQNGAMRHRRGLLARLPARPWDEAEILPHEHTLRGPKEDRLALMRATRTQTSPVFGLWDRAPGITEALTAATAAQPLLAGCTDGEAGSERHALWVVTDPSTMAPILEALHPARLYVADGHHRYETAVAYAQQRRAAEPAAPADADFEHVLVYLCAADDPVVEVLPTHRLVRPADGVPNTLAQLGDRLDRTVTLTPAPDLTSAASTSAALRNTEHAYAVMTADGAAVLQLPRDSTASARDGLDVVVLQDRVLVATCGLTPERVTEGALAYTRSLPEIEQAVNDGSAALGIVVNGSTTDDLIAVSDAREVMPQKSTYFYPKVPTGLVLSPL